MIDLLDKNTRLCIACDLTLNTEFIKTKSILNEKINLLFKSDHVYLLLSVDFNDIFYFDSASEYIFLFLLCLSKLFANE